MSVDPIAISRSALDVEWQRLEIIAQNLANENTTGVSGGGTYRPLELVSGPQGGFASAVHSGTPVPEPRGVKVMGVQVRPNAVRQVYDPRHPQADASGFVYYPNVDHAAEMAAMVKTARVYESNITVMSLAQQMSMRALEIGKR